MIKTNLQQLKIALVYDRVNKFGGAERVLLALHDMFPDAPLYTSVYDPKSASWAKVFPKVITSFLQRFPVVKNYHELFGWLMPIAFETFDFKDYDIVISITSEAAKGIITGTKTMHVCYCLTPTRYLWSGYDEYFKGVTFKSITKPIVNYLRWWDKVAAQRPDKIIAISTEVQKRIKKYYARDSEIMFPPVDLQHRKKSLLRGPRSESANRDFFDDAYYLYVGRLVKYKKVDLMVDTFNDLGLPLVVVGTGSEAYSLEHRAYSNIKFLGQITDEELAGIYQGAKAFLMPQEEDFGIASVEAQSFGVPVIAYNEGGARDTVVDGKTGVLFNNQTKESLINAIKKFDILSFNRRYLTHNAKNFSKREFKRKLQGSLIRAYLLWRRRDKTLAIFNRKNS